MFGGTLGTISNAADWSDAVLLIGEDDSEPVDLTGASVTFTVKPKSSDSTVLTGSTEAGDITFPDTGYIAWAFAPSSLTTLCAGTYRAGILIERDGETVQLFLGTVTIEEGF